MPTNNISLGNIQLMNILYAGVSCLIIVVSRVYFLCFVSFNIVFSEEKKCEDSMKPYLPFSPKITAIF